MAEYTAEDIKNMQRDAVRRVQEMNNRARHTLNHANSEIRRESERTEKDKTGKERDGKKVTAPNNLLSPIQKRLTGSSLGGISSLLSRLDGDTAILISLGLLLLTDEVDELLLLALVYIMM